MRERESSGERHRRTGQERERERERERKTLSPCYSRVSKITLYCSKDVKNFKNSMLDVDDILRG